MREILWAAKEVGGRKVALCSRRQAYRTLGPCRRFGEQIKDRGWEGEVYNEGKTTRTEGTKVTKEFRF